MTSFFLVVVGMEIVKKMLVANALNAIAMPTTKQIQQTYCNKGAEDGYGNCKKDKRKD